MSNVDFILDSYEKEMAKLGDKMNYLWSRKHRYNVAGLVISIARNASKKLAKDQLIKLDDYKKNSEGLGEPMYVDSEGLVYSANWHHYPETRGELHYRCTIEDYVMSVSESSDKVIGFVKLLRKPGIVKRTDIVSPPKQEKKD